MENDPLNRIVTEMRALQYAALCYSISLVGMFGFVVFIWGR